MFIDLKIKFALFGRRNARPLGGNVDGRPTGGVLGGLSIFSEFIMRPNIFESDHDTANLGQNIYRAPAKHLGNPTFSVGAHGNNNYKYTQNHTIKS